MAPAIRSNWKNTTHMIELLFPDRRFFPSGQIRFWKLSFFTRFNHHNPIGPTTKLSHALRSNPVSARRNRFLAELTLEYFGQSDAATITAIAHAEDS